MGSTKIDGRVVRPLLCEVHRILSLYDKGMWRPRRLVGHSYPRTHLALLMQTELMDVYTKLAVEPLTVPSKAVL